MGVILYDRELMTLGNVHDRIHLTADAGIMDWDNCPGPGGDGSLEPGLVQVKGIRPDIEEDRTRSAQHKRIHRGNERKIRDDDLIARLDLQQNGSHLQCMRARGGQQNLRNSKLLLQKGVTFLRERSIARDVTVVNRLLYIFEFLAQDDRTVEIDLYFSHALILADEKCEIIKTVIVQEGNIPGKIALAVIKQEQRVGII